VLDGARFIVMVAMLPGNDRTLIELGAMQLVELRRLANVPELAQRLPPHLGVPRPELLIARELVHHLRPFAVPFRVLLTVEGVVRHVSRTDHGARHDRRDFLVGACQPEYRARENALAGDALGE